MIDAFEMWLWRRILNTSWRERRTNEWVREQIGVPKEKSVLEEVKRRKIRKYGHWKRRSESLVLTSIEGQMPGRGRRGRRKIEWIDNIISWEGGVDRARSNAIERRSTARRGL